METALPLLLFLAGLFGLVLLVLICGMQDHELEQEGAKSPLSSRDFLGTSRFFAEELAPCPAPSRGADDSPVQRVEHYLQEQEALVGEFMRQPSVERLHSRSSQQILPAATLHERVERYLRREHDRALAFVSDPSIESLYALLPAA